MSGAWVTLATNDSYSLGALVLAHSLKQVGTKKQLVVLVTPGVTDPMRLKLSQVFNSVQEVCVLDSKDKSNLRLLQRPELGITFTKLHCWQLIQYEKCVFLDADTLVLKNCDELFEREELSAAPDVGWPDCFNSGVFVYRPSVVTYDKLIQFALDRGSFDGGDQGLLNLYFSDWAHKDISKHLPFIYNVCSQAFYSYLPAFMQFGKNIKIVHFIANAKPWLQYFDTKTTRVRPSPEFRHLEGVLQKWWDIFCSMIHPNLSADMSGLAGAFAKLTLGEQRTAEQEAIEDNLRRQNWEQGNIDYLGRDSFDNIWSKICATLAKSPQEAPAAETGKMKLPEVALETQDLPKDVQELNNTNLPEQVVVSPNSVVSKLKGVSTPSDVKTPKQAESLISSPAREVPLYAEIIPYKEMVSTLETDAKDSSTVESTNLVSETLLQLQPQSSEPCLNISPTGASTEPFQPATESGGTAAGKKQTSSACVPTDEGNTVAGQVQPMENVSKKPIETLPIAASEAPSEQLPTSAEPVITVPASVLISESLAQTLVTTTEPPVESKYSPLSSKTVQVSASVQITEILNKQTKVLAAPVAVVTPVEEQIVSTATAISNSSVPQEALVDVPKTTDHKAVAMSVEEQPVPISTAISITSMPQDVLKSTELKVEASVPQDVVDDVPKSTKNKAPITDSTTPVPPSPSLSSESCPIVPPPRKTGGNKKQSKSKK